MCYHEPWRSCNLFIASSVLFLLLSIVLSILLTPQNTPLMSFTFSGFVPSNLLSKASDFTSSVFKKSLRYQRGNQNPYIEEEQTTQWPKKKVKKDKQRSTKHTHETKARVTRIQLKHFLVLYCLFFYLRLLTNPLVSLEFSCFVLSFLLFKTFNYPAGVVNMFWFLAVYSSI